jgi:proteic killer suppression protein
MIQSFKCKDTHSLFLSRDSGRWSNIQATALRKLDQLEAATSLGDIRVPPGNRLDPRQGDRIGQHSIRINDQWRICFIWKPDGAHEVEIVDYH